MGYSYFEFWEMNPRILEPILEGYRLKRRIKDEDQWFLGGYVFEAVSIALANMFRKRGQKPQSYFEAIKKPTLNTVQNGELTEEEKQRKLDLLIAGLRTKQANFELAKQQKRQR